MNCYGTFWFHNNQESITDLSSRLSIHMKHPSVKPTLTLWGSSQTKWKLIGKCKMGATSDMVLFSLVFLFYIKFFGLFVVFREKINLWVAPKIKRIFYMSMSKAWYKVKNFKLEYSLDFSYHCEKYHNFHLISWCGNFVERHSFRIVLGIAQNYAETVPFHKISPPGN